MPDAAANQGTSRLAIRADRAFDGREMIPGGALVLCASGQIAGIEPGTASAPDGWPVAEFPGATVLPGVIDCHVHLCGDSRNGALDRLAGYSDDELGQVIGAALHAQLGAGVTTVRDLGDRRWAVLDWRQRATTGPARFPSPRSSHQDHRSPARAATAGTWVAKPDVPASFAPRSANAPSATPTSSRSWPAAGP
jgi:imidazolonepropionase-like amidohydrolase